MKLSAAAIILVLFISTNFHASAQTKQSAAKPHVELISAEELKAKMAKNEPVTIIDVRATESYAESDARIKGAIHVKLRRLKTRLALPPLNTVPRDREVVTYCACPSEESSLVAAQVLLDAGFKRVRALKGGWEEWRRINGQVEPRPRGL
jgi:rhodanese-related sulfurtransferase